MAIVTKTTTVPAALAQERLDIRFPQRDLKGIAQDDEWCELVEGEHVTPIRFHDYAQVFSIPGLYNQLFGGPDSETRCVSPQVMAGLLHEQLPLVLGNKSGLGRRYDGGGSRPRLRVLDMGAGNGMMGEEIRSLVRGYAEGGRKVLAERGSTMIVGLDILPEAKEASNRERPGVYDAYVAADITEYVKVSLGDPAEAALFAQGFNVLTSVSALAFGDGSVRAFKAAVSLVDEGGLLVFNLKEDFFDPVEPHDGDDRNGFSGLIQTAVETGVLSIVAKRRYCHRYSVTGEPLYYVAVVAVKHAALC
ncbi:hypothetical protein F5883DRAFT_657366 [Diaporthe sp. PMI_573]|nr:hypothetical protein F5883DRAFT_657366 [Diaporthaceae sp. PMI_573]